MLGSPAMASRRIHITGASGSGTTTLGRALAAQLSLSHFDTDDFYWRPTAPFYLEKRVAAERLRLMRELFIGRDDWVLSGSLDGWGDALAREFDLVVFLSAPDAIRLERLRAREATKFGAAAIAPGGARHQDFVEFMDWASHYEDGTREGRSRARHEAWLATLACPVLRLDAAAPVEALSGRVAAQLGEG